MNKPMVSVFMPVYNSANYLAEAIESVLRQSFCEFELVIVDDGSTDASPEIINFYKRRDSRVRVHRQENQGRVSAANMAMSFARGEYLARMDSDDIMLRDRLFRQVDFMKNHQHIGACGTWQRCFGGRKNKIQLPAEPEVIKSLLLFESAICGNTIMLRRQCLLDHNLSYRNLNDQGMAEDYDLIARMSAKTDLANIREVLMLYRVHPNQSVSTYNDAKLTTAGFIRQEQLINLDLNPSSEELLMHEAISYYKVPIARDQILFAEEWLNKLYESAIQSERYDHKALAGVIFDRWCRICFIAAKLGLWTLQTYKKSEITGKTKRNQALETRLALKCALRWSREWQ